MSNFDFLNKNMYRKYPLRSEVTLVSTSGVEIPQDLITSVQISTIYNKHKLFISKIYVDEGFMSVTINDYTDGSSVGSFNGKVGSDFSVLTLSSTLSYVSGQLTTGKKESLKKLQKGVYFLRDELNDLGSRDNGLLEDSTIFVYTPPVVSKIKNRTKSLAGKITTSKGDNINIKSLSLDEIKLEVTNVESVLSNNEFTAGLDNCPTPIIKKINSVYPDVNGNIDVYGIMPIVINVETGELALASGLDLLDVCPEKKKIAPPVDLSDSYYTDILTATSPEWKLWPDFT